MQTMKARVFTFPVPAALALGLLALGLLACPQEKKDNVTPAPEAPAQPASQPTSQPTSQAAKPEDHPKTTEPVALKNLFLVPETSSDVVIQVGEHKIGKTAFESKLRLFQIQLTAAGMPKELTREAVLQGVISQLVEPVLMKQVAKDLGIELDSRLYKQELKKLNQRISEDEHFRAFLAQAGNTDEQRKQDMKDAALSLQIRGHLTKVVRTETATSVADYYARNKKDYVQRSGRETWRIFIRASQSLPERDREANRLKAQSIHKEANKKIKDFEGLARLHSEGGKANSGGYIGWVGSGTFAKKLDQQIINAKANTILPLYDDASGFYIYKVGTYRKERIKSLDEVGDEIFNRMFKRVLEEKLRGKLVTLKSKIKVQVNIPELTKK
jgi:parvulin-like peptidyl-prolyl isomerase